MKQKVNTLKVETKNNPTTVNTLHKKNMLEYIVANAILLITFIAFGFISMMSLIQTSTIDPEKYGIEHILFEFDYILLNIIVLITFIIIAFSLNRTYNFLSKINRKFIYAGLFIYVLTLGLIWVFSVWQIPGADSANIFETATKVIVNDFTSFKNGEDFYNADYYNNISYYNFYPFQLGLVFISEIIYRIFGTETSMPLQVINVICTSFAYCGIVLITKTLFKRKSIELITAVLLMGCLQPILLCTFPYGNILGMCFGIWASYFLIRYLQTNKSIYIIPCSLLITIGVMAKYNCLIYAVAFAIVLLIHTFREKKIKSIAFALLICFTAVLINNIIIISYEKRAGVKLEKGMSQILYLDMGLNESYMAPGWYGGQYMKYYRDNKCDLEKAEQLAKKDITERINKFTSSPTYTYKFFTQKILSQWNEPTYQSIWVSKTKGHTNGPNTIANSVYDGSAGLLLEAYFNQYMQILFLLFVVGLLCMIFNKKATIENILIILVLLGGFGYHLLFEAKSQYSLTYIILMIPTAAFATQTIFFDNYTKIKEIINKLKNSHTNIENATVENQL